MSKKKNLFNLFPKKLANGTVMYYYTCYDELGKRKQFSTGEKDIQAAYKVCYERLALGKIVQRSKLIFKEYVDGWFVNGSCPYYSVREAKGRTYSKSSIDNKKGVLNKHLLPTFGETRLDYITTQTIEMWLKTKKSEGYAVKSINNYFALLNLILEEAVRTGYIDRNPCKQVIRFTEKKKEKDILTKAEIDKLFAPESKVKIWKDENQYLINYTAASTGCRVGELLALTEDKLHENYLEISASYDRKYGIKTTKSGDTRFVPISDDLYEKLKTRSNSNPGKYIFSTEQNLFHPISYSSVLIEFKKALTKIGVSENSRIERSLTFHGYRHYFNTKLRESGLPDAITRQIIGHKSSTMTENYSHIDTKTVKLDGLKIV